MFHIHQMGPSALTSGEVPVDIDVTPFDNSDTTFFHLLGEFFLSFFRLEYFLKMVYVRCSSSLLCHFFVFEIHLGIIGGMLGKSNFIKRCNRIPVDKKRSEPQIKNGDIMLTYIGLLCQGKTEYDTVHEMQDDPDFYKTALGITRRIPSAETLRQRMDDIGSSLRPQIYVLHLFCVIFRI